MALFICDSYYLINLTVQCNNVTYFTALTDWLAAAATVAIAFCTLATQSALAVLCTTYYVLTATKIIYISAVWMLSKRNYSVFIFDFIIFRFEHTIFYPALRTITKEHKNNTIFAFFEKKEGRKSAPHTHLYEKYNLGNNNHLKTHKNCTSNATKNWNESQQQQHQLQNNTDNKLKEEAKRKLYVF